MPLLVCSELDLKAGARATTLHLMSYMLRCFELEDCQPRIGAC